MPELDPQVSVIVPSYNHAHYIGETLESVLAQTLRAIEVLVVDDGSSDNSTEIIRGYSARDPRIRLLTHDGNNNRGLAASLILGVESSSAPLVGVVASDDRWLPERLERMREAMTDDQGALYCQARLIDAHGHRTATVIGHAHQYNSLFTQLLIRNVIPAPAVLMRRSAYERVGGYTVPAPYEDLDLMIRLAATQEVGFLPEPLVEYRVSADGLFGSTERNLGRIGALADTIACSVQVLTRLGSSHADEAASYAAAWAWLAAWETATEPFPRSEAGTHHLTTLMAEWIGELPSSSRYGRHLRFVAALGRVNPPAALQVLLFLSQVKMQRQFERSRRTVA